MIIKHIPEMMQTVPHILTHLRLRANALSVLQLGLGLKPLLQPGF